MESKRDNSDQVFGEGHVSWSPNYGLEREFVDVIPHQNKKRRVKMTTTNFVSVMEKVASTTKRLEKEEYLREADAVAKVLLRLATDRQVVFGVTTNEEEAVRLWQMNDTADDERTNEADLWYFDFIELCNSLASRNLTGNAGLAEIDLVLNLAPSALDVRWACRVLNKDLRAGISIATINKVFPKLSSKFEVALANQYDPEKHSLEGNYVLEPKLDGLRMVVVAGAPFTRNGKQITSAQFIIDDLKANVKDLDKWVLDGELMGEGTFDEASGVARRKDVSSDTLVYHVFDMIKLEEWNAKQTSSLLVRKKDMAANLKETRFVRTTNYRLIPKYSTAADLFALRDELIGKGYEGAMIKNLDAPYRFKRSDDLLKFKNFLDADGEVVDFFEGRGKYKGMLGGLIFEIDGVQTRVGSGFNDEMRKSLWDKQTELVGRTVEVKFQEKTKYGVLRFPTFIKFRHDK